MERINKILGTLYGQAIGDAMGMPSELWPVEKIRQHFNGPITDFLDGPKNNDVAINYQRGEFTDDTGQALAILDSLIETNWQPDQANLVKYIMAWADSADAWENNILGPSSKAALLAIKNGKDSTPITATALTNGAGMRIAPIGSLFKPDQLNELVQTVYQITKVTHSSDVAIGGACMIAGAVTAAVADYSWDEIIEYALSANELGYKLGSSTWAAKSYSRLKLGLEFAQEFKNEPDKFSNSIYNVIGTGTMISESIPASVAIAYYTRDVKKCALMCANLGGDTDTIGAMSTAICGAKNGFDSIDPNWIKTIDAQNPQYDLKNYANKILNSKII